MAGHSKFKNIQHRKGAQDKKRAKIFTRLVREIITAASSGQPDPALNPRLRTTIATARAGNLPKERIDRAIKQATDTAGGENYVEMRYEGFAPGGIAIIVECLTDNKNRTAGEVRAAFTKFGGNLGETGSVSFMFDHVGIIEYPQTIGTANNILESAIEAGCDDVESDTQSHIIYTSIEEFQNCLEFMQKKYGNAEDPHLGWKPQNFVEITEKDRAEKLLKMIDLLEESDDVQRVFGNYEFSNEVYEQLAK